MKNSKIFLLLAAVIFLGCPDDERCTTCPPLQKDMRNLTWTVDTLAYPGSYQTSMYRIWAGSSRDVYVVGHNERGYGKMYHYDGTKWESVKLAVLEGGNISVPIDLANIQGFTANNIYAVGEELFWDPVLQKLYDSSMVIHYDGMQWKKIEIEKGGRLQAIGGASSDDFWIGGGLSGTLYHVINGVPQMITKTDSIAYLSFIGNSPNNMYALAYQVDKYPPLDSTRYYILHYDGSKWSLQDFYIETFNNFPWTFGVASLWVDKNSEVFYSVGFGIYKKIGSSWVKEASSTESFRHIYGSTKNNIFVVGGDRQAYHFNGTNWKQLNEPSKYSMIDAYEAVWTDGEEVFILGSDGNKSYVLHGR
ncbi:MAG: hypothetical protein HYV29_14110 [Ignavibacteriales bacterium]|nr:hypothetical protein [Ignavibacteriales bacterium]